MINPTAAVPLPHGHSMAQVEGLDATFSTLEANAFGAADRTQKPMCRVEYTSSFQPALATDVFMGGGMSSVKDNASMFYGAGNGSGGGDTTKARIKIPISGWYYCHWFPFFDGTGTTTTSAHITCNGVSVSANAIISAQGVSSGWSAPKASDVVWLNANDILYFVVWHNTSGAWVRGTWWANKSNAVVQWVGP